MDVKKPKKTPDITKFPLVHINPTPMHTRNLIRLSRYTLNASSIMDAAAKPDNDAKNTDIAAPIVHITPNLPFFPG